mgnify:FL=1|jgi:hypothetical protein
MRTKEEVYKIVVPVGQKAGSISFSPVKGRVIGLLVFHNKGENFLADFSLKNDAGQYVSKPQHIANYRSRNSCYFSGCKPVDFETQGATYYAEVVCDEEIETTPLKLQLILIYEDERFNENCKIN